MIRPVATILVLLALTACGADGEPVQPSANVNVSVSEDGLRTGATVGARKGPWAISLGRIF